MSFLYNCTFFHKYNNVPDKWKLQKFESFKLYFASLFVTLSESSLFIIFWFDFVSNLKVVFFHETFSTLLFFRHNDLPWNVRKFVHNQLGEVNLSSDLGRVDPWATSHWSHTDIPRLRAGLVGAQVSISRVTFQLRNFFTYL